MRLDVPVRRMADVDMPPLDRIVERLRPLFDGETAPVWGQVAERSEWIGKQERPTDIGFRKMQPTHYVQLCVVNDEEPHAPWALDIPVEVWSRAEQLAFAAEQADRCRELYGEGELVFAVFAILGPGGVVPRHRDMPHDRNKKAFSHHLHAPITEAEACELTFGKTTLTFERGGLYEVDNMIRHSAIHRGLRPRVNLMLDYCPAARLEERAKPQRGADGERGVDRTREE
jgi:hypothetical protein